MMIKCLVLLLTALFLTGSVMAQSSTDVLTAKLARQYTESTFPGFCVSVVKEGKVAYQQGFGYADVSSKVLYTGDTIQPLGSVSKTVIGIALMKAIEMGYFSLDTPINDILPFNVANPRFPERPITLRQLATHTSGIVDREAVYQQTYQFGSVTPDTSLHIFLFSYFDPKGKYYSSQNFAPSAPGSSFHYGNIGATLAAYSIEVKSGISFAEFTKQHIFQLAHMESAAWFNRAETAAGLSTLYDPKLAPYPVYSSITYPDGTLRSSCADLSKYLLAIMHGYSGSRSQLLSTASFQEMLRPQFTPTHTPNGIPKREPSQGIFFAFRRDGSIGHTGSDYGVTALMFFNPQTKTGKIFMANTDIQESPARTKQFAAIWKTLDNLAGHVRE